MAMQQLIMYITKIEVVIRAVEGAGRVDEVVAVEEETLNAAVAANQITVTRNAPKGFVKHAEVEVMTPGVGTVPTSD